MCPPQLHERGRGVASEAAYVVRAGTHAAGNHAIEWEAMEASLWEHEAVQHQTRRPTRN